MKSAFPLKAADPTVLYARNSRLCHTADIPRTAWPSSDSAARPSVSVPYIGKGVLPSRSSGFGISPARYRAGSSVPPCSFRIPAPGVRSGARSPRCSWCIPRSDRYARLGRPAPPCSFLFARTPGTAPSGASAQGTRRARPRPRRSDGFCCGIAHPRTGCDSRFRLRR